jgi:lipopolysaccharide export system permease protein
MKIIDRHIAGNILLPLFAVCFILTAIIWLTQSLRFVDLMINNGVDFLLIIKLSVFLIPSLMNLVMPVSCLVAVILIYNKLWLHNEINVLRSAGVSNLQLSKPALIIAVGVCLFGFSLTLYISPTSYRMFKDMQSYLRSHYSAMMLAEKTFNNPIDGLTIYIEERESSNVLKGVLLSDNRNINKRVTVMAQEAQLVRTDSQVRFDLINGNRQEIDKDGKVSMLYFDHYPLDISNYIKDEIKRNREVEELYLNELILADSDDENVIRKMHIEKHQRLTWPLLSLFLSIIAATQMLRGSYSRFGNSRKITIITIYASLILGLYVTVQNLSMKTQYYSLMYIYQVFLLLFTIWLVRRSYKF